MTEQEASATGDSHEREATILDAYLRALDAGEAPVRDEILARHPDLAAELGKALDGLELVHRAAHRIAQDQAPAGTEEASVGAALGDYRLLREVGRGGMAVVYEAEQISLRRRVALKVLPFAAVLEPISLQRFKNEALAAAHLNHPHIVPVYGVGCDRGVHYYVMPYVEGQSLDRAIREMKGQIRGDGPRTPLSSHASNREAGYIRMAASLAAQAAEALDHAHNLGVVHRDVKPANLLVDGGGSLWVTDFGLARTLQDASLTLTGELLGTVRYMSPEQAHTKPLPIDHRTDVYALGATLYELLTLEPAFPGDDPQTVILDIAAREPVPPRRLNPSVPRDLETVVLKAMAKDPAARYATAQEMANDIRRHLSDRPVLARRPSVVSRVIRWSRRHRLFMSAACGLLFLGLAALIAYGARIAEEQRRTASALNLARDAVDKYLVEGGIGDFGPELFWAAPVNEGLLETALAFYEGLEDVEALRQRARILMALGRYDASLTILDRVVALRPADAHAAAGRGTLLWRLGRHRQASAEYERAIAMEPKSTDAYLLRALLSKETGHLDDSIRALREALQLDPDNGTARCDLGIALHKAGEYGEAIEHLRGAVESRPGDPVCRFWLGKVLMDAGDVEHAIPELRSALRSRPGFGVARTHLGMALDRLGERKAAMWEFADAIRSHLEVLRVEPRNAESHFRLGFTYAQVKDFDRAAAAFREAIRLRPDYALAHANLAETLGNLNKIEEGTASAREAIGIERASAPAWMILGSLLGRAGKKLDEAACYREAIRLRPGYIGAYVALGGTLRRIDPPHASDALREALHLDPNHYVAHRILAEVLEAQADPLGAIEQLQAAIRINSTDSDAHLLLGSAYAACSEIDKAIESYREAVRLDPSSIPALGRLGDLLVFQGRFREALPILRNCRDLCRQARPEWLGDAEGSIESAERCLTMESALDRLLAAETRPSDASECLVFAEQLHGKHLPLTAASFYARAFEKNAALADNLGSGYRYDAACSAVVGAGHAGESAGGWRQRALEWLRHDLAARQTSSPPLTETVAHWRRDPDLTSVRDRIDALPEREREGWRRLWADVDAAIARPRK